MPLVRISLNRTPSDGFAHQVGDCVHRAMVDTIKIPPGEVPPENFSLGNGEAQFADRLPAHLQTAGS